MTTPTGGPGSTPSPEPTKPASNPKSLSSSGSNSDAQDAFLLQSPFAKMFSQTGAAPTAKEMKMIIDNILKSIMNDMKQQEAQAKKAAEHLKKVIEGEDD